LKSTKGIEYQQMKGDIIDVKLVVEDQQDYKDWLGFLNTHVHIQVYDPIHIHLEIYPPDFQYESKSTDAANWSRHTTSV
jgi:hypothetical protein